VDFQITVYTFYIAILSEKCACSFFVLLSELMVFKATYCLFVVLNCFSNVAVLVTFIAGLSTLENCKLLNCENLNNYEKFDFRHLLDFRQN